MKELIKEKRPDKYQAPFLTKNYFFLEGFWLKAEPAAVLLVLLKRPSRRTFDAAEAALILVTLQVLEHLLIFSFLSYGEDRQESTCPPTKMLPVRN